MVCGIQENCTLMTIYTTVYIVNKGGLNSSGVAMKITCRNSSKSVKCGRVDGGLSVKVNRPGREVNHLAPRRGQAKNNHLRIFKNRVLKKT